MTADQVNRPSPNTYTGPLVMGEGRKFVPTVRARRRLVLRLALLVDLLEEHRGLLEPRVRGVGAHGPFQAIVDAANLVIDETDIEA